LGGYQLFEQVESGIEAPIQLASLGNFGWSTEIASEYANATNTAGRNGSTAGSVGDANFAQTSIRSDRTFSPDGQQIYSDIAGYPIRTVDDLSGALRRGDISPSDVPVDFVDMNGSRLILNTRTSTALQDAGIPQNQWYGTQRTGQTAYTDPAGNPVTYNDLATNQLNNNNLPPTGSPTLPTGQ
jgi:filamentous hemagglutinin